MASDYDSIRADNERRYGTDIGRIGPMLLANRYADRTHFIFELLQNAEDALARRRHHQGARAVNFVLAENELRVSNFGEPFDERDVRGICGIAESTKDLTNIGCFGIGFKSVYAFTDRPVIHSGDEDFTIEHFVWPTAAPPVDRKEDETLIVLPLKSQDGDAREEIARGLRLLEPRTLLFLRQIAEIAWRIKDGPSGLYLRESEALGENVRRITVIGQGGGKVDVEETWLVFSRPVMADGGRVAGQVEIAFSIATPQTAEQRETIRPVKDSPLVVFFPTILSTNLGFLVQGPYRTTPSRDNVPRKDPWNQTLVKETASLLLEALRWLRNHGMLDTSAFQSLPLERDKFDEGSMFSPLFEAVRNALRSEPLLPRFGGGYVAAGHAKLAGTRELRELFGPSQLAALFGQESELAWLTGDITQNRTPQLHRYLTQELEIAEVTSETILPKLNKEFLEAQSDEWIVRLYEFLNGQPSLRWKHEEVPLIRLKDGKHVTARSNGKPLAFLPGQVETDFPTVKASVCSTEGAREFLKSLGVREPDPVDDVILNVLPKYNAELVDVSDEYYAADIGRILAAFKTDSTSQRYKLTAALKMSQFVKAVDAGDGSKVFAKAAVVYLATQRLKDLFDGIFALLVVDNSCDCLQGEEIRGLLVECDAARYLRPIPAQTDFTYEKLQDMRREAGCERNTGPEVLDDKSLLGLEELLAVLPTLDAEAAANRSRLLWEALTDLEGRGHSAFLGKYSWFYYTSHSCSFDAAFVRRLNEAAWVHGPGGTLQRPGSVLFEETGWEANPFLLSKIRFKPPLIEALAKEAGIEPGVLDLLKKHGLTSVAELTARLDIKGEPEQPGGETGPTTAEDALKKLLGDVLPPTKPVPDPAGVEPSGSGGGRGGSGRGTGAGAGSGSGKDAGERADGAGAGSTKRTPGGAGGRPFISYVAAQPDEEDRDPDGLDYPARMALEAQAINLILAHEPKWQRTPTHNHGYDLFEAGDDGQPICWVEVKAMTGGLHDRPVGLSRTQFECAREHSKVYWLYVVEHAGKNNARIVRIQDPAGKARTFTFDRGWLAVAQADAPADTEEPPDPEEPT